MISGFLKGFTIGEKYHLMAAFRCQGIFEIGLGRGI